MKASAFRRKFCFIRYFSVASAILATYAIPPAAQAGQSDNRYTVSVLDLKTGGKGQKAFEKGSALLEKGDDQGSLAYFTRAVAENPAHYKAYYDLGVAQYRLGRLNEAQQAFQTSIDLTGGRFAPPQFGLGMLLCEQQQFQQAEAVIQRGLETEPGSASGKYFLGWAQYGLNRLVDAERSLRQALLRNGNLADAYALLIRIHQRQANAPATVKDLQEYLKIIPKGPQSEQARHLLELTQQQVQGEQSTEALSAQKR